MSQSLDFKYVQRVCRKGFEKNNFDRCFSFFQIDVYLAKSLADKLYLLQVIFSFLLLSVDE